MLIKHLKVEGLLSFGPDGIDLPLNNLNVLIGPNGSGKSNLIEVLTLMKAAPRNLPEPVKEMGGVREWLWKGADSTGKAMIDVVVKNSPGQTMDLRHVLCITEHGNRFEVVDERIENENPHPKKSTPFFFYQFQHGKPVLLDFKKKERTFKRENIRPEESILSQIRDPESYPVLAYLQEKYADIRLFRSWLFGPGAALRREQNTQARNDFLSDGGENLGPVLSRAFLQGKRELIDSLRALYDNIEDLHILVDAGNMQIYVEESGGRQIPATRLSDGTLRYLCLLAILLHPNPPAMIAIEEPELGLHPDILPHVAQLLRKASEQTQLIVTTHSRILIDALGEEPESVIVCEKADGQSHFERLNADQLKDWLDTYSLGQLWSKGEIGGNRW